MSIEEGPQHEQVQQPAEVATPQQYIGVEANPLGGFSAQDLADELVRRVQAPVGDPAERSDLVAGWRRVMENYDGPITEEIYAGTRFLNAAERVGDPDAVLASAENPTQVTPPAHERPTRRAAPGELALVFYQSMVEGALDDRLPSEGQLADGMGVSRSSIREAFVQLRSDGMVETQHGIGHMVANPHNMPQIPRSRRPAP